MVRKKKIVHIISSLHRGGAETILLLLIKQLVEFEHHVFYIHEGPLKQELIHAGITVYPLTLGLFFTQYKNIKKMKPDCIISSLWLANMLSAALCFFIKIPTISILHALREHQGWLRRVLWRCWPFSPRYFVAVSQEVARSFTDTSLLGKTPCITILNGIDVSALRNTTTKRAVSQEFVIGAVGRFVPVKNYDLLLESVAHLVKIYPHCRLLLVGQGPEELRLRQRVKELAITKIVRFIVGEHAAPYYAQFDCFVQSHKIDAQGLTLTLLEALYCQLPVIVSGKNKQHALITHEYNGLLVEHENKQELIEACERLINDQLLRTRLKRNTRETVLNSYTIEQTAAEYRKLIDRVLCSNS